MLKRIEEAHRLLFGRWPSEWRPGRLSLQHIVLSRHDASKVRAPRALDLCHSELATRDEASELLRGSALRIPGGPRLAQRRRLRLEALHALLVGVQQVLHVHQWLPTAGLRRAGVLGFQVQEVSASVSDATEWT
jgi:hypothetical protein